MIKLFGMKLIPAYIIILFRIYILECYCTHVVHMKERKIAGNLEHTVQRQQAGASWEVVASVVLPADNNSADKMAHNSMGMATGMLEVGA